MPFDEFCLNAKRNTLEAKSLFSLSKVFNPFSWGRNSIVEAEQRATVTFENSESLTEFISNTQSSAGESVGALSAWRFSAVYRSIALISETVATLPFSLYKFDDNGNKFQAKDHFTYKLFKSEPNQFQTWFDFKSHIISQTLSYGNGYAYIRRDKYGRVLSLEHLSNNECVPYYVKNATQHYLYYYVFGEIVEARDIFHLKCIGTDGVVGRNPIEVARDAIGTGLAQQNFTGSMYKNGLNLQGVLEHPATLSEPAQARLRKQMEAFKGSKNASGSLVLEEGLTYKSMSISPIDAQFIESKKFTIEEIARFYGVPLHKIGSLDKATNNNIEHQDLEFYKNTLLPWEERFEQEFDRKLLLPSEKGIYKHQFDNSNLLRTDTKARMEWINGMFTKGAITPNEIRVMEGLNAKEGERMNETFLQLAMSPINELPVNSENNDGSKQKL